MIRKIFNPAAAPILLALSLCFTPAAKAQDILEQMALDAAHTHTAVEHPQTIPPAQDLAPPLPPERHGVPLPVMVEYQGPAKAGEIVINIRTRRLYLIGPDNNAVEFHIAVGKSGYRSPTGSLHVTQKRKNPTWTPTPDMQRAAMEKTGRKLKAVKGGDPKNPLGTRALNLGHTYYRIHGTHQPWTVGKAASQGCFRMVNDDVELLFDEIETGAKVTMIDAPFTLGVAHTSTRLAENHRETAPKLRGPYP